MAWRERKVRLLEKPKIRLTIKLIDKKHRIYGLYYHINKYKQLFCVSSGKEGKEWQEKLRRILLKDPEWKKAILYDIKQSALSRKENIRRNVKKWGIKYEIYKVKKKRS